MSSAGIGSRLYLIERLAGRHAHIESWSRVQMMGGLDAAMRQARKLAIESTTAHRVTEFAFIRVVGIVRSYESRRTKGEGRGVAGAGQTEFSGNEGTKKVEPE